ncbi:SusD/RagB family nutrient-binding outer membrane lipoprotein [Gillisia hiemivivida]|uniref:SusD/RagB family nutrient-binding outer membrane lipoprotein n=1 Tax=Gillisia hiemivivida TaxID=291190 RepID=A0A5C6ZSQ3_9FLAO|nr:SusD/RagB family nutrient-binding outer membrane lipoprotein [Gillisia hiemivivida]TXD93096.1 SusD/RagB family nutrient-binding outer membrane lipoprotein [Gillisia hiemivivida]
MKSKNIFKILLTAIFSFAVLISCDYDDVNQDPTRPGGESVPLVAVMPAMQTQTHRNIDAVLGRYAGIIMQQWQGFDAQQLQYTSYVIGENDTDNPWDFGLYTGSMRDAADIIERATITEALNTRGVAKIYMAINLGLATNVWGDVPYSEAFLGKENLSPKYDDQEELYGVLQTLLSGAIEDLNAEDPAGIQGDLLNGSNDQWIAAAHSLKARFYIQQTSVNSNAAQLALDELDLAISSNAEQLNFQFENTQNGGHPLALFGFQRPNTMIIDGFFADLMMEDPRMDKYMFEEEGNFFFFDSGNPNLFWAQLDSPNPVISYSETKFIEAEALARTGGDGTDALEEAVRANMSYLGIASTEIEDYISSLPATSIQTIILEKYKAMYGQSPMQVWNDYRRTGFPDITANENGANGNNPSGIVPRRLLYPISERLSNPDEYQAAIDAQGGHLLDDDIWVFPLN